MAQESYRKLHAWQKAMLLAEEVYRVVRELPRSEVFGLSQQLRRAAASVPSNIAEGYGRMHRAEYAHHVSMARGSLFEIETQVTLAVRLKLLPRQAAVKVWLIAQETGRILHALLRSLRDGKGGKSAPDP